MSWTRAVVVSAERSGVGAVCRWANTCSCSSWNVPDAPCEWAVCVCVCVLCVCVCMCVCVRGVLTQLNLRYMYMHLGLATTVTLYAPTLQYLFLLVREISVAYFFPL